MRVSSPFPSWNGGLLRMLLLHFFHLKMLSVRMNNSTDRAIVRPCQPSPHVCSETQRASRPLSAITCFMPRVQAGAEQPLSKAGRPHHHRTSRRCPRQTCASFNYFATVLFHAPLSHGGRTTSRKVISIRRWHGRPVPAGSMRFHILRPAWMRLPNHTSGNLPGPVVRHASTLSGRPS